MLHEILAYGGTHQQLKKKNKKYTNCFLRHIICQKGFQLLVAVTFCSLRELQWLVALSEKLLGPDNRREEAAEVSVCQPLQDPSPC